MSRSVGVVLSRAVAEVLENRRLLATWYVDNGTGGTGVVGTDGPSAGSSLSAPLRTINYAAQRAQAGDTVLVRKGVYREEVRPLNSGTSAARIVYQPYNGESVSIRGTNKIATSWTNVSGSSTYFTSWPGDYSSNVNNSDQVFVNDQMVHLARWPNLTSGDLSRPTQATVDSITSSVATGRTAWNGGYAINRITFTDSAFSESTNFWVGAKIWMNNGGTKAGPDQMQDGNGVTGTVISTDGATGTLTVELPANAAVGAAVPGNFRIGNGSAYYLFDPVALPAGGLSYSAQWWRDRRGTSDPTDDRLYLRSPSDAAPAALNVEVKQRDWAFNFDTGVGTVDAGRRFITVKNIDVFGASITTDHLAGNGSQSADGGNLRGVTIAHASNIILDGLKMKFVSHFTNQAGDLQAQWAQSSGVILSGTENVFQNGEIAWSAGSGIIVLGARNKVLNSRIHDTNYNVTEGGAIGLGSTRKGGGPSLDAEIAYNEVFNTGVDGIQFDGLRNSTANRSDIRARIHHNIVHDTVLQSADSGGIKMVGADGRWVRIDHNIVYNTGGPQTASQYLFYGIYLDYTASTAGGYIVDHNVVFASPIGININRNYNTEVYNNTLMQPNVIGRHSIGNDAGGTMDGVIIRNNLANRPGRGLSGTGLSSVLSNNVFTAAESAAWFNDAVTTALASRNYALVSTATTTAANGAINRGVSVSPFDDLLVGAADLGAYEFGSPRWSAGVSPTTPPAAPSLLSAASISTSSVLLSWVDNSTSESAFQLERSLDGATGWLLVGSTGENGTQLADAGLMSATRYYYRLQAINPGGTSAYSNTASVVTIAGNIIGSVYRDSNANGRRDDTEDSLSGRRVYLDQNGNGTFENTQSSTVASGSLNVPIPDNSPLGLTHSLNIGLAGTVSRVTVTLSITHTYDSDLIAYLVGPDGTQVTLFSAVGGSGANFAGTTLADSAALSINDGAAPFSGTFRPAGRLSSFSGKSAAGAWKLKVVDTAGSDVGTLASWSVTVETVGETEVVTDANGFYSFGDLPNGNYSVRTVLPPLWMQTSPIAGGFAAIIETGTVFTADFGTYLDVTAPTVTSSTFKLERLAPSRLPHQLSFIFSEPITGPTSLLLENLSTGVTIASDTLRMSVESGGSELRYSFDGLTDGLLPNGSYRATLMASAVADAAGNVLASDATIEFGVLAGDVNSDSVVNFNDLVVLAQNYNQAARTFAQGNVDFSEDGLVSFSDLVILAQHYQQRLIMLSPSVFVMPMKKRTHWRESL